MSWIERFVAGDQQADEELVNRYSDGLLRIARQQLPLQIKSRVDPEDIVQSVYRSFFRRLQRDEFRFEESLDVWRLLVVMTYHRVNNIIAYHRRKKRNVSRDTPLDNSTSLSDHHTEARPEDLTVLLEYLELLLDGFPDRHRQMVELRLCGHSIAEIAEATAVSRRTVIRVLQRCRVRACELSESEPKDIGDHTADKVDEDPL